MHHGEQNLWVGRWWHTERADQGSLISPQGPGDKVYHPHMYQAAIPVCIPIYMRIMAMGVRIEAS